MRLNIRRGWFFGAKQHGPGPKLTEHHIVLVAGLRARPGREKQVCDLIRKLLEPTRAESGCLTLDLHRSVVDSELFFIYQVWQDELSFENHTHTEHARAFKNAAPELLEGPVFLKKWQIVE
jgi:quinol monooxygenase YgiN